MKQVEIFKTDVRERARANKVLAMLGEKHPDYLVNFDIEDDDRILRVESTTTQINKVEIESLLEGIGVYCKIFVD
jgi:hypothetical protein